jgi:hypothetical protein
MKITVKVTMAIILFAVYAQAAETADWSTAGQVTYSMAVGDIALGGAATAVDLSQFNSSTAAAQAGTAYEYTLTKVVFSIDGSISGTLEFQNTGEVAVSPELTFVGASSLSYDPISFTSASENYAAVGLGTVNPQDSLDHAISSEGSGKVTSPDIVSDLSSFIGAETITTEVSFPGATYFASAGSSWNGSVNVVGSTDVTVTYFYTPVPEPTSMALLVLSFMVLLCRRNFNKQSICEQTPSQ